MKWRKSAALQGGGGPGGGCGAGRRGRAQRGARCASGQRTPARPRRRGEREGRDICESAHAASRAPLLRFQCCSRQRHHLPHGVIR